MQAIGTRYTLGSILGQGGMATVYQAYDQQLQRDIALKVMRPDLVSQTEMVERFLHEARLAASFTHAHIARVYDVGTDEHYGPFFVQELIAGQSLDTLLPAPTAMVLQWLTEIGGALQAIHRQGLVHCDVKPQNVRITPNNQAVLIDFGIAQPSGATGGNVVYGTPHYMAPERAQGAPPTAAADVYALGVLSYEMLSGKVPLDGATPVEVVQRHIHEGVPALRHIIPGQAAALEQLILKATARQPEQRYQTVDQVLQDLEAIKQQAINPTVAMPVSSPRATVSVHNKATKVVPVNPKKPAPHHAEQLPPPPAAVLQEQHEVQAYQAPIAAAAPVVPTTFPAQSAKPMKPLLVGCIAALALLMLFLIFRPSAESSPSAETTPTNAPDVIIQQPLTTPRFVGMGVVEAQAIAVEQGLRVEVGNQLISSAPAGQIIAQQPPADAPFDPDAVIIVQVSLGPENAQEPPSVPAPAPADDNGGDNQNNDDDNKDDDKGKGKGKDKDKDDD